MDSFELTKLAGAVLCALLLVFGFRAFLEERLSGHHSDGSGYALPAPAEAAKPAVAEAKDAEPEAGKDAKPEAAKDAAAPAEAVAEKTDGAAPPPAAGAAFDAAAVVGLVAAADAANGEKLFRKCLACHSADKSGASKPSGPSLWNVVGRARASKDDFKGYSNAMKAKDGTWTYAELAAFIHKPNKWVSGTKMIFPGIKEPKDIADVLAHLRTLADSPAPVQ